MGNSRDWRIWWWTASGGIAAPWKMFVSRRGALNTHPTRWQPPSVSFDVSTTVWTRLLHPAVDGDDIADPVLTLTSIILLLRPLDVWWVTPFVLAAACLSLVF